MRDKLRRRDVKVEEYWLIEDYKLYKIINNPMELLKIAFIS